MRGGDKKKKERKRGVRERDRERVIERGGRDRRTGEHKKQLSRSKREGRPRSNTLTKKHTNTHIHTHTHTLSLDDSLIRAKFE